MGDRAGEGRGYGNLGNAHFSQGGFSKTFEYHMQRMVIAKEVGDRVVEGRAYAHLGSAYRLQRDVSANLSNAYGSLGDFSKAIE